MTPGKRSVTVTLNCLHLLIRRTVRHTSSRRHVSTAAAACCAAAAITGASFAVVPPSGAHASPVEPGRPAAPPPERRPTEFAFVFTLGYGDDLLPQDEEQFDAVMEKVAAGGFNVVLASYEDWRIPILRRHGLKLMVNMLDSRHHVYKNVDEAEKLARSLRGNEHIWGYHMFSDTVSTIVAGRQRDVANLHDWDPTHPTFVGFKHSVGSQLWELIDPDVAAYYDYHWVRDRSIHFANLARFARYADDRGAALYRWTWVENGKAGIGNPNRSRYTVSTSMAFGLDGAVWFIGQDMMSTSTWEWNQFGLDTIGVNLDMAPAGAHLVGLKHVATYSTETTRTANDKDKGPDDLPIPSPLSAFPDDHWLRATGGEVVIGEFEDSAHEGRYLDSGNGGNSRIGNSRIGSGGSGGSGESLLLVANHNAYQPQSVVLEFAEPVDSVQILDRETRDWLELTLEGSAARWELGPGYGDLIRVSRGGPPVPTTTATSAATSQSTATVTSESTPDTTPDATPDTTPEATPGATTGATPQPTASPGHDLPHHIALPYAGAAK